MLFLPKCIRWQIAGNCTILRNLKFPALSKKKKIFASHESSTIIPATMKQLSRILNDKRMRIALSSFFPPSAYERVAVRRTWKMVGPWSYLCKERSMLLRAREYHSFWPFCLVPPRFDVFWLRLERFASKHANYLICWRLRHLLAINIHVCLACDILFETALLSSRLKRHCFVPLLHRGDLLLALYNASPRPGKLHHEVGVNWH